MAPTAPATWGLVVFVALAIIGLAAVLGLCASLLRSAKRRKTRVIAIALPGCAQRPEGERIRPEASPGECPVCGATLPGDLPEALCPQCLMQCALSRSDAEAADGAKAPTGDYANLPPVPVPAELAPHFPDLEILEFLGQGGMGAVYKARQRKLDRLVALKVLPAEWGKDPAFADRFGREAKALARLNHPQVVGVHDFGEAGGHFFLIMEYVDGVNLRQLLAGGRLQPSQALATVAQICDALQYAHEQGVVHRDIKPENILLDRRGRVKIADFGLAKLVRRSRSEFTLTGTGQVMGTLDYMAPEQRTTPQTVDHRADIYSLGVVFYEMLTGELPLGRFAPPSERVPVDGRLDEVIFRALEREPDRRYQRISAVKEDVQSILRTVPLPAAGGAPQRWEIDFALARIQTLGPAAGLIAVAFLQFVQAVIATTLALTEGDRVNHQHLTDDALKHLLYFAGVFVVVWISAVVYGALKLAQCRGYGWVMMALVLLVELPLGYHWFVQIPLILALLPSAVGLIVAVWAIEVLRRPQVREAFALSLVHAGRPKIPRRPRPPSKVRANPMRSFFRSLVSLFVTSPPAERPAQETNAAQ